MGVHLYQNVNTGVCEWRAEPGEKPRSKFIDNMGYSYTHCLITTSFSGAIMNGSIPVTHVNTKQPK